MEEEIIAWQHNIFLLKLNLPKFKQKLKSARGGLQMTIWSIQLTQRAVLTKKKEKSVQTALFNVSNDLFTCFWFTPVFYFNSPRPVFNTVDNNAEVCPPKLYVVICDVALAWFFPKFPNMSFSVMLGEASSSFVGYCRGLFDVPPNLFTAY